MMVSEWNSVKDVFENKKVGDRVKLRGWIYRTRSSGGIVFIVLRDSTGIVQITVKKGDLPEDQFKDAEKALVESSIMVEGIVREDKRAPGSFEVKADKFNVVNFAEPFPITKDQSIELLLDYRHLWLRSRRLTLIMKIKAELLKALREWFDMNGFYETTPSVITTNAAEGGATVFSFDYFGRKAFLSQTAQMYLEALIYSLERVWCLTPSFRAEKSRTPRHLTEYWHLEAEEAWVDNNGNMEIQEKLISYACNKIAERCENELTELGRNPDDLKKIKPPFKRIKYEDAVEIVNQRGVKMNYGDDFGAPHEKALVEGEEKPVFVTDFPAEIKAFYMKENSDGKTVKCSDMYAPEGYGELIGGSERSEDIERMKEKLLKEGADIKNYEWYFDLRRYGSVPHSGFGLGIERLLCWITKQDHIRNMTPFPRTITRVYP